MTTETRNEAAERLHFRAHPDHSKEGCRCRFGRKLDEALAAEHRATVERIRTAFTNQPSGTYLFQGSDGYITMRRALAILDEEAAR